MNVHIALSRFAALTCSLEGLTEEQRAAAIKDRETYAQFYVAGEDRYGAKACLAVRFMHEVCNVPLAQARECVIGVIRKNGAYKFDHIPCLDDVASEFVHHNQNVLLAEVSISLYVEAAKGTAWAHYWDSVLHVIRNGQPYDGEGAPTLH